MSLNSKKSLTLIAKELCRNLRSNQTGSENSIWEIVRNRKLLGKKFLRQHPIFYNLLGKESFYICDFYCHELNFVIEIDGKIHDYNKGNDSQRDKIISLLGIYVLRIRNEDVESSITKVTADIQKIIMELETKLTHPKSLS